MMDSAAARTSSGLRRLLGRAALPRDQPISARRSIGLQQSQNLSLPEAHKLGRSGHRQSQVIEVTQHIQSRQFLVAHDPNRHPRHLPSCTRAVSFQTGREVTFSSGRYKLLKLNPDYGTWTASVPDGDRARIAFLRASTWADAVKGMPDYRSDGFSNGNRPSDGPEATQNIGYADHLRHKYWHFIDIPFSPDGTMLEKPATPNVETQIAAFRSALAAPENSNDVKSYDLAWLIHLVGDAHQPLHSTSRFTKVLPHGDDGGNAIKIDCGSGCTEANLHAFWDDVLGPRTASLDEAIQAADDLPMASEQTAKVADEKAWLSESFELAKTVVYAAPIGGGVGPYRLTDVYKAKARDAARDRVALAGARLARLLNQALP